MTQQLLLTSDLVGIYWLRSLDGFPENLGVATELPSPWGADNHEGRWLGTDFITVTTIGGAVDLYSPEYSPAYQIDCWSRPKAKGSQPPWNRANQLAEVIRHFQYLQTEYHLVTIPAPYPSAYVVDTEVLSEPRRVPDDPLGLARYTLDIRVTFVPEE